MHTRIHNPQDMEKEHDKEHYLLQSTMLQSKRQNEHWQAFLRLVEKHFPKSNKLHKIFNRNTLKVSHSCTENMAQIIRKHTKEITKISDKSTTPVYNCRIKTKCPLNGSYFQPNVIYQATTKSKNNPEKIYIRLTERPWKQRS